MRRLLATLRCDVTVQYRNKFYAVSALVVLVWGGLLGMLAGRVPLDAGAVVPAVLVGNLLITTFYFVGALVLLEKAEGTLSALVTTPLRDAEYLASKAVSLTLLAAAESLVVVVALFGAGFRWAPLLAGALLLGGFYTLVGFGAIARYDSISAYLMPSTVVVTALVLPLLPHFGLVGRAPFLLHPVEPALALMRAAFAPAPAWEVGYGAVGALAWLAAGFVWARRRFRRFVVGAGGA